MAQPLNPGQRLKVLFSAAPDENGVWWVVVTHQYGPFSVTYGIPLDQAEDAAADYAANLTGIARDARRERSGLKVVQAPEATFNRSGEAARRASKNGG